MPYKCIVCEYIYESDKDGENDVPGFEDLPDNWKCPECGAGKQYFKKTKTDMINPDKSNNN